MTLDQHLQTRLAERHAGHRYRSRAVLGSAQGPVVQAGGKTLLNFCANDYLGLAGHPKVVEAMQGAASKWGAGSGASHLVCGHSEVHHALEDALAEFTGRERALLFSTGFMANTGIITALVGRKDSVIEDKLNHASLLDAGLASGAEFLRFRHNDTSHLEQRLKAARGQNKLIVADGVFSMDGDFAPMPELAQAAKRHNAWLMMDDAHGFGCLGNSGAGTAEHFALNTQDVPILMATLGKALGVFGAFVAGSEALIEALIQFARPYIYTTAMPPAVAAAALAALGLVRAEPERRAQLQTNIRRLKTGLADCLGPDAGLQLMPSNTAIQPLLVGDDKTALQLAESLRARGVWVSAIRPPTVPEGTARLRITLSAAHTAAHIDQLLEAIHASVQALHGR